MKPANRLSKSLSSYVQQKSWPLNAVLLLGLILATAFAVSSTKAAQQESDASTEQEKNSFSVFCIDQETGEPDVGVEVQFDAVLGRQRVRKVITSDKDGLSKLSWDDSPPVNYLTITATKPGYVPIHRSWMGNRQAIVLPEQVEIDLVKGSQIDGVVQDEAGAPIANAKVDISLYPIQSEVTNYAFGAALFQTDEFGKWSWDCAPSHTERISIRVTHPDYTQGHVRAISLNNENVTTLKQGLEITGRVVDGDGKPIENASATFGITITGSSALTALTDADGRFELTKCKAGRSAVTVLAKSFAPQRLEINVSKDLKPLEVQLQPGNTIHIKVVDPDGEPIKYAQIAADSWSLRGDADANGEFVWEDAPAELVGFDIRGYGYISNRNKLLSPDDEPQTVTLNPKLVINGSVKESESGDPVDDFQIIPGFKFDNNSRISWSNDAPIEFTNGRYEFAFDEPREEYYLKIIGRGYEAEMSRAFRQDEGLVKYDFKLKEGWTIRGVLRRPDGTSVSDARIFYVLQDSKLIRLTNGLIDIRERGAAVATTDRTGRFTIKPTGKKNDRFFLIASSDEGIATYKFIGAGWDEPTEFNPKKILNLELEPWGKMEGTVFTKGQPAASQKLTFYSSGFWDRVNPFPIAVTCSTTSDGEGKYEFARLPAGKGEIAKSVARSFDVRGRTKTVSYSCWQTPVSIVADETASVDVTKFGVVVKGSVTIDKQPNFEIGGTLNKSAEIQRVPESPEVGKAVAASSGKHNLVTLIAIDADGNFEIPDVPPGNYELTVTLFDDQPEFRKSPEVGTAKVKFTVEKDQTEPLDLGKVVVKLLDKP